MTEAVVSLAAGCILQIAETRLVPDPDGWTESTHIEVAADPRCGWVRFPIPATGRLISTKARTRLGDGTRTRLPEARWETSAPTLQGVTDVTLHLPELVSGDRAVIDVVRQLPPGPMAWRPGPARYWQVDASSGARLATNGAGTQHPRRNRIWTSDAPPDLAAQVDWDDHTPRSPPEELGPPGIVDIEQHLTLQIPPGDPQVSLYPGGGSRVVHTWYATFGPSSRLRGWAVPAPPGVEIEMHAEPRRIATLVHDAGIPRVRLDPFEGNARVTVSWTQADAPTFGVPGPEVDRLIVDAPGGDIAWEGDAWRLVTFAGRPVIPDRAGLVRALDRRFAGLSLPEPGAPIPLRGREPGVPLMADLRPALADRAPVGHWPTDPLWIRPLSSARRSGAVTPTEAAVILQRYALQLRLESSWGIARPAHTDGVAPEASPAGFTHPLVVFGHGDALRWADPACTQCGPFELPPEATGTAVLGPGLDRTPDPVPGRQLVRILDDRVEWQLSGPAALEMRRWLSTLPEAHRTEALAQRIGGPNATLISVDGLAQAGAPIRAVASRGDGILADPLQLPPTDDAGRLWTPWIGERRLSRPATTPVDERTVQAGPMTYTRVARDGLRIEQLVVDDRWITAEDTARLRTARDAPDQWPAEDAETDDGTTDEDGADDEGGANDTEP